MSGRTALLIGATGLVGGHCLGLLLADEAYAKVFTLGRRPPAAAPHPRLEHRAFDFDRPESFDGLPAARDVYCCLGTTIRKAGSQAAFRRVDFTYQYEVAAAASRGGAEQLLLVSSLGAGARSRLFYSRVKGELEEAVSALPYEAVGIFRPSLLLGEREEFRRAERLAALAARALSPLLAGPLGKYRPVEARAVASAMVRFAKEQKRGVRALDSDAIREMAGR